MCASKFKNISNISSCHIHLKFKCYKVKEISFFWSNNKTYWMSFKNSSYHSYFPLMPKWKKKTEIEAWGIGKFVKVMHAKKRVKCGIWLRQRKNKASEDLLYNSLSDLWVEKYVIKNFFSGSQSHFFRGENILLSFLSHQVSYMS